MNTNIHTARAGDAMPASPGLMRPEQQRPEDIPQREDYVPPVGTGGVGVIIPSDLAMGLHKFVEVNAVYPETKDMADRLRAIIEGR